MYDYIVGSVCFAWARRMSAESLRVRGFDFGFAALMLEGPTLEREDQRQDSGDGRIIAIGLAQGLAVTVVYTDRAEEALWLAAERRSGVRRKRTETMTDEKPIRGSCLCGGVSFEIARAIGPFELCHCTRCRKASGSAFVASLGVRSEDFRLLTGAELIHRYEAPLRQAPPAYRTSFCSQCGSPVPDPPSGSTWFEVPAGLLHDDPRVRPDRHIFAECKAPWYAISDGLPQLDQSAIVALRSRRHPQS